MTKNERITIVSIAKLDAIVVETIKNRVGKECVEIYKYLKPTRVSGLRRHLDCISLAFKVVRNREKFSGIIFWQQFIGLYYNVLCYLFFFRNGPRAIILTVIYLKRKGILGKCYHYFYKISFRSRHIDKLVCHSSSEKNYYLAQFGVDLNNRVIFCKLGEGLPLGKREEPADDRYFFSGGSSNRDYRTLVKAFTGIKERLIIACKPENIDNTDIPENVTVKFDAYGSDFINLISGAYAVILPIADSNVSSGQLVLLNAMRFGKSTIVTSGNCMRDYIRREYAIEVPPNSVEKLKESVISLAENPELNTSMSKNAFDYYNQNFSIDKYAGSIAEMLVK